MLHRGARVDLDKPDVEVRVDHEVIAEHLVRVLTVNHHVTGCKHTPYNPLLNLWLNLARVYVGATVLLSQVVLKRVTRPHIPLDI